MLIHLELRLADTLAGWRVTTGEMDSDW
jgi:hypothetical protein